MVELKLTDQSGGLPEQSGNVPKAGAFDDEGACVGEEFNDLFAKLFPWAVSSLLHTGLILVSVFLAWTVTSAINSDDNQGVIIPVVVPDITPGVPLSVSERDGQLRSDPSSERPSPATAMARTSRLLTRRANSRSASNDDFGSGSTDKADGGTGANGLGEGWSNGGLGVRGGDDYG